MLHLEYQGTYSLYVIEIPKKIICYDKRFIHFYGKLLELEVEYMFDEPVARIINWVNHEWFWMSELEDLIYIDYERVKNIKAFI